jgi:hypothetical protein
MEGKMNNKHLYDLVDNHSPKAVLDEVQIIAKLMSPGFDHEPVSTAFRTIVDIYEGNHPGYKACNTEYHDLQHTTDTFLAMARLLHGAQINGEEFSDRHMIIGLIAALFHDAGYIQEEHDGEGTGAKHTADHEQRSANLLQSYGLRHGLARDEIDAGRAMILCTDIRADISKIVFPSAEVELLGKMLTASDLMAQMADRSYLEKLLFLYHEFKEANMGDYQSDLDLLKKTVTFYDFVAKRMEELLDRLDQFITSHFLSRWNINKNLYQEAIERQKIYLQQILDKPDSDPRDQLKRAGIVKKVRKKYGTKD